MREARRIVQAREPSLARVLSDALLLSWLTGAERGAAPVPVLEGPTPSLPRLASVSPSEEGDYRLPAVEAAAASLQGRRLMDPPGFARLEQDARRGAFAVAGIASEDMLARVQQALAEDVGQGGTLAGFRRRMEAALGGSMLGERHLETVYRTNVSQAHNAGLMEALSHPLVSDELPYLLYSAVHDARARPGHLAMERHGLDGTAVYRRDDPVWRTFLPPWDYNCRCAVIPLTIEDAAAKGVREAREWLRSGFPPARPEWVEPPPFAPSPAWQGAQSGERIGGIA